MTDKHEITPEEMIGILTLPTFRIDRTTWYGITNQEYIRFYETYNREALYIDTPSRVAYKSKTIWIVLKPFVAINHPRYPKQILAKDDSVHIVCHNGYSPDAMMKAQNAQRQ